MLQVILLPFIQLMISLGGPLPNAPHLIVPAVQGGSQTTSISLQHVLPAQVIQPTSPLPATTSAGITLHPPQINGTRVSGGDLQ